MKQITYKGINAYVREDTSDEFVVHEIFDGAYSKLNLRPEDVVVDFGLNIGMFTLYALNKGVSKIYSFEPDPDNFTVATSNLILNNIEPSRYTLNNFAVVGNDDDIRYFSVNQKKNKGAHSLIHKRGRNTITVNCININKVLNECKPSVVKMDIEGGEYECLPAIESYDGIRELILEFHHAHLNDIKTHDKYREIISLLKEKFDEVQYREDTKGAWVNTIYCKNYD